MKKQIILMFLWMTFLTGFAYPMLITVIAQFTMKEKADGAFITSKGKVIGSLLIAQKFESDRYFWPRPSAVDYNPLPSGGSNLGPTSRVLRDLVKERSEKISKTHGSVAFDQIPSELLYASASGLDPHISPKSIDFQFERVVKARKFDDSTKEQLRTVIKGLMDKNKYSFLGAPCINVLELNATLDELKIGN